MAKLADAPDLGSGVFDMGVQVPSSAPKAARLLSRGRAAFSYIERDLNGQGVAT